MSIICFFSCPVNPELVGEFETISKGTLRAKLQFFGFSETAKVYYKGDVRPCLGDCSRIVKKLSIIIIKIIKNYKVKRNFFSEM